MSKNKKAYDFAENFSEMEKTNKFDNHGDHTTIVLNVHLSALEACAEKTNVLQDYGVSSFEKLLEDDIAGAVQLDAYQDGKVELSLMVYDSENGDGSYPIPLTAEEQKAVKSEIEEILYIDLTALAKLGAENQYAKWSTLVQESVDWQNQHELEMNGLAKKYILISPEMIEPNDFIATEPEYIAVSFVLPDDITERFISRERFAQQYHFKDGKEMVSKLFIDYEAVVDGNGFYELRMNIEDKKMNMMENPLVWLDEMERKMLVDSLEKSFCADFKQIMTAEASGDKDAAYQLIVQSRKMRRKVSLSQTEESDIPLF